VFAHLFYTKEAPVNPYVMRLALCCGLCGANSSHRLLKTAQAHNFVTMSKFQLFEKAQFMPV